MIFVALHGIVTALVTPFRTDERIDCSAWQKLVDAQIAAGVDGLLVGGSTGEFYAQDLEERTMGIRFVRQAARELDGVARGDASHVGENRKPARRQIGRAHV